MRRGRIAVQRISYAARCATISAVSCLALVSTAPGSAETLTVSQSGGQYTTINGAIEAAEDGDVIEVEPGVYNEDVDFCGKEITVVSIGGASVTTIASAADIAVRLQGGADAILDGFTLISPNAHVLSIQQSSPTILDCVITGNTLYAADITLGSAPVFEGCTITDNDAYSTVFVHDSSAQFTDCSFLNNHAVYGGGLFVDGGAEVTVERCTFMDNAADEMGGAIHVQYADVQVFGSTFESNDAEYGTISLTDTTGNPTFERNLLCGNIASHGSGLVLEEGADAYLGNNVFQANSANLDGGALLLDNASASVVNNTFLGNEAGRFGGHVLLLAGSHFYSNNNIFAWATQGDGVHVDAGATYDVQYSDFWLNAASDFAGEIETIPGDSNYAVDPGFEFYNNNWDCYDDDLRLAAGSPLIDAGDPEIEDLDGTISDVGAYGGPAAQDDDGDGYGYGTGDCDDGDGDVHPGADEVCDDWIDNDCDGGIDVGDDECDPPGDDDTGDDDDVAGDDDTWTPYVEDDERLVLCRCRLAGRRLRTTVSTGIGLAAVALALLYARRRRS